MANLPLGFALILGGGVLTVAGITGSTIGDVISGKSLSLSSSSSPTSGAGTASTGTVQPTSATFSASSGTFANAVNFAKALLKGIGAPQTQSNINAVVAWQQAESPVANASELQTDAAYNPLNTTLELPGSTDQVNTGGGAWVQSYSSPSQGLTATIQTLLNTPAFAGIVSALRAGVSSPAALSSAVSAGGWGTGPFG